MELAPNPYLSCLFLRKSIELGGLKFATLKVLGIQFLIICARQPLITIMKAKSSRTSYPVILSLRFQESEISRSEF
jgi:hypothetical protein